MKRFFQYNVPLAELKRVNRLLNEKDFFAKKTIKIPVKPSSLLTEILPFSEKPKNSTNLISNSKLKSTNWKNPSFQDHANAAILDVDDHSGKAKQFFFSLFKKAKL